MLFADIMVNMGYSRKDVEDSLTQNKYDDITATYLLLGRRTAMVSAGTSLSNGVVRRCHARHYHDCASYTVGHVRCAGEVS